MGWLFMPLSGRAPHRSPKTYLDAQFSFERARSGEQPMQGLRLIKSSCVGRVYYAAVQPYGENGPEPVTAVICLFRWNPRASDGFVFGYKDMGENAGPCEANCPEAILDLLEPTDNEYANRWRSRCRDAARLRKRQLPDGSLIRFDEPISFTDGTAQQQFRTYKSGRQFTLVSTDNRKSYRISRLLEREFHIVTEPKVLPTLFSE